MNLNLFISGRIGKKALSNGKLSKISNVIASLSVGISVAIMILAIAISNGFRNEVREKASGFNGDMVLSAPGVDITNHLFSLKPLSFIDSIASLDYVKSVHPIAYRTALLKSDSLIQGVLFKGVDEGYNMEFFTKYLEEGEVPDYIVQYDSTGRRLAPSNDILISRRLADMLNYKVGDRTLAYFIDDNVLIRRFTIKGIFNAQLDELDKSLIIADIGHISRVNGWKEGELSGYELILDEKGRKNMFDCCVEIEQILFEQTMESDDSVVVNTLEDRFYVLFDWLHLLDMNVVIILALMVAVAGFNMISGLLIILFERISQIGLFKALGMRNSDISKIFLYRAAYIVFKGLLFGNAFALIICWIQSKYMFMKLDPANYFVSYVPIDITFSTILLINVLAFVLIMLILVIPCHMISRISPAKTLIVK